MQGAGDDWASATGWDESSPAVQSRKLITAISCRECGSIKVHKRDNGMCDSMVRWDCSCCGRGWKEPAGAVIVKCWSVQLESSE